RAVRARPRRRPLRRAGASEPRDRAEVAAALVEDQRLGVEAELEVEEEQRDADLERPGMRVGAAAALVYESGDQAAASVAVARALEAIRLDVNRSKDSIGAQLVFEAVV